MSLFVRRSALVIVMCDLMLGSSEAVDSVVVCPSLGSGDSVMCDLMMLGSSEAGCV